jgi:hypothetical protein
MPARFHLLARPAPMFSIAPLRCRRLTVDPTCSRIAARKITSPLSKPLAVITRPAMSSVLSNSPAVVLSTPRHRRDRSARPARKERRGGSHRAEPRRAHSEGPQCSERAAELSPGAGITAEQVRSTAETLRKEEAARGQIVRLSAADAIVGKAVSSAAPLVRLSRVFGLA